LNLLCYLIPCLHHIYHAHPSINNFFVQHVPYACMLWAQKPPHDANLSISTVKDMLFFFHPLFLTLRWNLWHCHWYV
jgi:hypothetical protein